MLINSKNDIIGNFTPYNKKDIISFLFAEYDIKAHELNIFNNAMDNTVIDIDERYILKIYETKTFHFIKSSLNNYQKFKEYYCIDLINGKNGSDICFFNTKPTVLYKKVSGCFQNDLLALISHISKFHKAGCSSFRQLDLEKTILEITQQIDFYFNDKVYKELEKRNRLTIYKNLIAGLSKIKLKPQNLPLSHGFIHGDCSPDNLIKLRHDVSFLDFDSIKTDFQLFDLTDLLLKYSDEPKQDEELKIIQEYIKITGFYKSSELMCLYNMLNVISCYRGLLMALSTEYYCFENRKFSPEVMDAFFLKKVLLLANNTKYRLKELKKCQEKSQEHTVESMATLKTMTV